MRALEGENAKLTNLLAEAMLDKVALKDLASREMVTPGAKREAIGHAREHHGLSERRGPNLDGVSRRSYLL